MPHPNPIRTLQGALGGAGFDPAFGGALPFNGFHQQIFISSMI